MAKSDPFADRYHYLNEAWTVLELFADRQTQAGRLMLTIAKTLTLAYVDERGILQSELDDLRTVIDKALEWATAEQVAIRITANSG